MPPEITTVRLQSMNAEAVTGVQLAQGIGVQEAKGFWADAWSQVLKRPAAIAALSWLAIVAFFAVFAPFIASGHPVRFDELDQAGAVVRSSYPLFEHLEASDLILALGAPFGVALIALPGKTPRSTRLGAVLLGSILALVLVVVSAWLQSELTKSSTSISSWAQRLKSAPPMGVWWPAGVAAVVLAIAWKGPVKRRVFAALWSAASVVIMCAAGLAFQRFLSGVSRGPQGALSSLSMSAWAPPMLAASLVAVVSIIPVIDSRLRRVAVALAACALASVCVTATWTRPLSVFSYAKLEQTSQARAVYTIIPWSPDQGDSQLDRQPPGSTLGSSLKLPPATPTSNRSFLLGTDALGQDVLSQLMHACRLSISIGLVSTGIAVVIGVTMGALMGYFGGVVDLLLFRVVEVFMAVPLLFLLMVAAAVLPPEMRSTYVMMAIIGCFTWTGAARFTRAEFMKLRSQDFVQSAKAVGLPLRSILFKHMLPNGVTPVLVDASFGIAAAITIEATLSFLGLGPADQASWGKLLASATNAEGQFKWWLAIFPGLAIFLTVLSYNLIGEALRDAIDPKLKKARA